MLEILQGKKDEVIVIEDIVSESSIKRIPAVEDGQFSRRKEVKRHYLLPVVETSQITNNSVRGKEMVFFIYKLLVIVRRTNQNTCRMRLYRFLRIYMKHERII